MAFRYIRISKRSVYISVGDFYFQLQAFKKPHACIVLIFEDARAPTALYIMFKKRAPPESGGALWGKCIVGGCIAVRCYVSNHRFPHGFEQIRTVRLACGPTQHPHRGKTVTLMMACNVVQHMHPHRAGLLEVNEDFFQNIACVCFTQTYSESIKAPFKI